MGLLKQVFLSSVTVWSIVASQTSALAEQASQEVELQCALRARNCIETLSERGLQALTEFSPSQSEAKPFLNGFAGMLAASGFSDEIFLLERQSPAEFYTAAAEEIFVGYLQRSDTERALSIVETTKEPKIKQRLGRRLFIHAMRTDNEPLLKQGMMLAGENNDALLMDLVNYNYYLAGYRSALRFVLDANSDELRNMIRLQVAYNLFFDGGLDEASDILIGLEQTENGIILLSQIARKYAEENDIVNAIEEVARVQEEVRKISSPIVQEIVNQQLVIPLVRLGRLQEAISLLKQMNAPRELRKDVVTTLIFSGSPPETVLLDLAELGDLQQEIDAAHVAKLADHSGFGAVSEFLERHSPVKDTVLLESAAILARRGNFMLSEKLIDAVQNRSIDSYPLGLLIERRLEVTGVLDLELLDKIKEPSKRFVIVTRLGELIRIGLDRGEMRY